VAPDAKARYRRSMAREPFSTDDLFLPVGVQYEPLPDDIRLGPQRFFPPPTCTTPDGLLCVGGRLSPEWLLDAYRHGIFPWPMWDDEPIAWWSPDPRAIIDLVAFHVSRRLKRTLRHVEFAVTCDRDFEGVIRGCATSGDRDDNTWLTPAMIDAYCRMHELGHAHSVEVWSGHPLPLGESRIEGTCPQRPHLPKGEGILVGGTYGIAIGGLFAAESMFYWKRDASKVAIVHLVAHLRSQGYTILDIQQLTPHTASMGAVEISRVEYLRRLAVAVELPVTFGERLEGSV
jgi:leucyl/phenylalanyl-tRNA---protein transferase